MEDTKNKYAFMKSAFENATRNARVDMLFQEGLEFIDMFLEHAKQAGSISRYFQQHDKEHPVLPHAVFYVVGVDDEWRYGHSKRGGARRNKERALVDYYMHAEIQTNQAMAIRFTTSQHAHAAKKMGWNKGVKELVVNTEDDLSSIEAKKFVQGVADFLAAHALILTHQGERRRRTGNANGPDITP